MLRISWQTLSEESPITNNSSSRIDRKDSEVSPSTILSKPTAANARGTIAPWEQEDADSPNTQLKNYRNDLFVHQGSGTIPSINRQPPSTASPWPSNNNNNQETQMPTSIFDGSFYNDSNENLGQISPGFAPNNGVGFPTDGDDRRPSIASATTVSSSGSKSSFSGKVHKKLQGFFGEDVFPPNGSGSRQNSETSSVKGGVLPAFAPGGGSRNRNNSMNDAMLRSRPPSPSSSRPRTPGVGPSSEVTPWVYQDTQVSRVETDRSCMATGWIPWKWLIGLYRTRQAHPTLSFPIRAMAERLSTPPRPTTDCTCLATGTTGVRRRSIA